MVSFICDNVCVSVVFVLMLCVDVGVISADHEDEAQRPKEASDGEVQGRGGPGLWWSGQVLNLLKNNFKFYFEIEIKFTYMKFLTHLLIVHFFF